MRLRARRQRATLILSVIAGFQILRQMMGLSALADAKSKTLIRVLGPLFQHLIDGEPSLGETAQRG